MNIQEQAVTSEGQTVWCQGTNLRGKVLAPGEPISLVQWEGWDYPCRMENTDLVPDYLHKLKP